MTLLLATAALLGALHTFEPDHLAAVSAFVARRPSPRAALGYSLRWALGHGGAVLLAGAVLLTLRLGAPAGSEAWLERAVGVSLIGLGVWVAVAARRIHAHRHAHADGPTHTHLHYHTAEERHAGAAPAHGHRHAATVVGALHGLAGTAPAIALVPLAGIQSAPVGIGYLAAFGLGTATAMALYGMFAGAVAGRLALRSEALARGLGRAAGLGSVVVGVWWVARTFPI